MSQAADLKTAAEQFEAVHAGLRQVGEALANAVAPLADAMLKTMAGLLEWKTVASAWAQGRPYTDRRKARRVARMLGERFTADRSHRPTRYWFR